MGNNRPLKIWLGMMVFSVLAAIVLLTGPQTTGFFSYDAGPQVEFNPDYVGNEEWYANTSSALTAIIFLIIAQVGVYYGVKRYYANVEEEE